MNTIEECNNMDDNQNEMQASMHRTYDLKCLIRRDNRPQHAQYAPTSACPPYNPEILESAQ